MDEENSIVTQPKSFTPLPFQADSRLVNKPLQTASLSAVSWKKLDQGSPDQGSRIKDQGSRIKDQFIVGRRKLTLPQSGMAFSVFSIFSYFRFSIREILTESRRWAINHAYQFIKFIWFILNWSLILDPWSGDPWFSFSRKPYVGW